MSGLTPEEIEEIRTAVEDYDAPLFDVVHQDRAALLIHVDHLTVEIERLRAIEAGCERLCHRWRGSTNPALHMERDLHALLNPPTEGETDDLRTV